MSPRAYEAKLDLLRVQNCLWARMKPVEIARKLRKDKAWVSRTIRKIEEEGAMACLTPKAAELIEENTQQLQSLLSEALGMAYGSGDAKTRIAAIRTASDLLRQKSDYQITVGLIPRGVPKEDAAKIEAALMLQEEIQTRLTQPVCEKILAIIEKRDGRRPLPPMKHARVPLAPANGVCSNNHPAK